ncbi:MAG: hypothetical protein JWL77_3525 [Chthonomonadaceae bacterium]|nr:hypothetical protein [Chthonomonadaceae bacterium]
MSTVPTWHSLCKLREDVKHGTLQESEFAAKLNGVRVGGNTPEVYRDAEKFFSRTFPTLRMKDLVRDVFQRLADKSGKPVVRLQVSYGGGKTHTLITLLHLAERASEVAANPTVKEFIASTGLSVLPSARVALLPLDDFGYSEGFEAIGPDGVPRRVKTPWGALAYQLAGDAGYAKVQQHEENYEPPAEPLLRELLEAPLSEGKASLILVDEAVIYCRKAVNANDKNLGTLKDFFQVLTQAVAATPRACIVATLLASENEADDVTGARVLRALEDVFGRLATTNDPVGRDDLAEVLRRRLFEHVPTEAERRPIIDAIFAAYSGCKQLREGQKDNAAYQRFLKSYPFHPDVLEVLYAKWTELARFQRTRGALRLLAQALQQSDSNDPSAVVGIHAFLGPGKTLPPIISEMARICSDGQDVWTTKLNEEMDRARESQDKAKALKQREIEQAVLATFIHCQPQTYKAETSDLYALLVHPGVDLAALETGLEHWRALSWFLTEEPSIWRITTQPNLTHIHVNQIQEVEKNQNAINDELLAQINKVKELSSLDGGPGGSDAGVIVHRLPQGPKDVDGDTPDLRYLVLPTDCAVRLDTAPPFIPGTVTAIYETRGAALSPRTFKNVLVALAPDATRLIPLRRSVVEYLAWQRVENSEAGKSLIPTQKKTLAERKKAAEDNMPAYVRATYGVVLDLDEDGNVRPQSLKSADALGIQDTRPFARIKAMLAAEDRLNTGELAAELLLPDSYYDLWSPGETSKRAKDMLEAFAQFPRLPRFLSAQIFRNTLATGCKEGALALRLLRPDKTFRTLWRVRPPNDELARPELEILPINHAELTDLDAALLAPEVLPHLWKSATEPIVVADLANYFNGKHAPRLLPNVLATAIAHAVQLGHLWARTPSRSYFKELMPSEALTDTLELLAPPDALKPEELLPDSLGYVWTYKQATLDAVWQGINQKRGYAVPWALVRNAVDIGKQRGLFGFTDTNTWPCAPDKAGTVTLTLVSEPPKVKETSPPLPQPSNTLVTGAVLTALEFTKISDILSELTAEAPTLTLSFEVSISAEGDEAAEYAAKLNAILATATSKLKFGD